MADKCHVCGGTSYDDCSTCGRPTCRTHGNQEGDVFRCWHCIEEDEKS